MKFYIVDAFATQAFGGNPAGVVLLDEGGDFPTEELMRKTAAELRYSETAFIKRLSREEFEIRYFTPAAEVDLCGHATIGSFCALRDIGLVNSGSSYINNTLAGKLNIEIKEDSVLMDMGTPMVLGKIQEPDKLEELYKVMGISGEGQGVILKQRKVEAEGAWSKAGACHGTCHGTADGKKVSPYLLPELVSTGLPDIMLPVASLAELAAIKPDFPALSALSKAYDVVGVHAFTVNGGDGSVHCRNFAPLYEIDEEAATGTSNGALTYYLYRNGLLPLYGSACSQGLSGLEKLQAKTGVETAETLFIQGEAMDRPSQIRSTLTVEGEEVRIQVGGSGVILAHGEIVLPC